MTTVPPPPPVAPPPAGSAGEIVYPTNPPADPTIILLLNLLLFGGVGYLKMGQKMKGIVAIIAWIVLVVPTCGSVSFIIAAVAAVDGYMQAEALKAGHPVGAWTFFKDHR